MRRNVTTTIILALALSSSTAHAGLDEAWENFKLRASKLRALFTDQEKELADIRKQGLKPEQVSRIDLAALKDGGPPKDGIPSIDRPRFDTAESTPFAAEETVIGIVHNGEAKAYPYAIMNWHEVVNDTVGGTPLTVTYCPLCDTVVSFERGETTFGVSGKLFQSCLVMYDRADETLYAQPWALGIVGKAVNNSLARVASVKTTLGAWLREHPDSKVLSPETGHDRDYSGYPYGTYYTDRSLVFPVRNQDFLQGHPKDIVSYVWRADKKTPTNRFSGDSAAFLHDDVREKKVVPFELMGEPAEARWNDALNTVVFVDAEGNVIPSSPAFRFVYPAYFGSPVAEPDS